GAAAATAAEDAHSAPVGVQQQQRALSDRIGWKSSSVIPFDDTSPSGPSAAGASGTAAVASTSRGVIKSSVGTRNDTRTAEQRARDDALFRDTWNNYLASSGDELSDDDLYGPPGHRRGGATATTTRS